jgi:hypothetical protein
MCKFFSFVGDGYGNYQFGTASLRAKARKDESIEPDSHTWLLTHYKVPEEKQALWSRYEYNPLTKEFTIDQGVEGHDHALAERWVKSKDFGTIVPKLIIKPMIHPFRDVVPPALITEEHLALLKAWASVRASVRDSVGANVGDSVMASVWDSVRGSVRDSVMASVWDSIGDSVMASVWGSAGASVWDSIGAYISSFFASKYKHDFSPAIKLWEMGLVPSYDGKLWRLHGGKDAKVLWEGRYE